ncbi:homeodomain-only protein [Trichomycterus rosablanca]|uniref:homeodomain-only protein n=1 Tax=Trichomycterus rosablanca TaxID=2290929 RepID=UPI002F35A9DF
MACNGSGTAAGCTRLDEEQLRVLEENFTRGSRNPDGATLALIAAECGLSEEETKKWFSMRNAQWRKAEGLPAQLGSVKD